MWIKVGMALGAVISMCVIGTVIWLFLQPAFAAAASAAKCSECEQNLRLIGNAIEQYYQEKGHYPPAVSYDDSGNPLHSWRVLILPYLGPEAQQLFEEIRLGESYNSKHNQQFHGRMPPEYHCPEDKGFASDTSYLAIVGEDTLINSEKPASRKPSYDGPVLRDHPAETMVVLEACDSRVTWMKPKDISVPSLSAGLNSSQNGSPNGPHLEGVNILMADQSIIRIPPDDVDSTDLRGMATIDGQNEYIEVLEEMDY